MLLASDSSDPPSEYEPADALLGANYSIPLLWLSMFTTSEIVWWPSTVDKRASYAAVIAGHDACVDRSRNRIEEWNRRWPETFNELGPMWMELIQARTEQFFAIWTEELAEMSETAESWLRSLSSYLSALDDPNAPGLEEVLAQSFLTVGSAGRRLVAATQDPVGLLAGGYSWATRAPWAIG